MVPDLLQFTFSELTRVVTEQAPGLILSISSETESVEGELADGILDFAIDIDRGVTEDFNSKSLAILISSIWMREGHPLADKQ